MKLVHESSNSYKGEAEYHFRVSSLFSFHVERFRVPEGFCRDEGMKRSRPIEGSVGGTLKGQFTQNNDNSVIIYSLYEELTSCSF